MINSLVLGSIPTTTFTTMAFVSLSFLILMLLIKKFAWESISSMLEERATTIANDLDNAEQAKLKANSLIQQTEEELAKARTEAAAIIKRAKENAENNANSIIADAQAEAQNYREKAQRDMKQERVLLMDSARQDVADLSMEIATKIVKKELSKDGHEDLINSQIEGL